MTVYMDYNARAPLRPEAVQAMQEAMRLYGNPSSPHHAGRAARALMDEAREQIAALCHARADHVIFTSSGTEANALAMRINLGDVHPAWFVSAVEHVSVLENAPNRHEIIPVNDSGRIVPEQLSAMIANAHRPFVSVMIANNETGIIQPIAEIAAIVKERGGMLHCDAAQAAGKMNLDIHQLGADALSLSAHKMGGPPGIGALVLADECQFAPLIKGGGQEFGQRAGTENLIAIAGFAAVSHLDPEFDALAAWREQIERALPKNSFVFGQAAPRLANTSCFALPGLSAQAALIKFDLAGICLSSGAACSSGKVAPSHVLAAQNAHPEHIAGALRISLGWQTDDDDVSHVMKTIRHITERQAA